MVWLHFITCREEKPGFFARLKKRGAKNEEEVSRRTSKQIDPKAFPEVKSRKSTLPPIYPAKEPAQSESAQSEPTAEGEEAGEGGGRRRRRRPRAAEDPDEVDGLTLTTHYGKTKMSRHIRTTPMEDTMGRRS